MSRKEQTDNPSSDVSRHFSLERKDEFFTSPCLPPSPRLYPPAFPPLQPFPSYYLNHISLRPDGEDGQVTGFIELSNEGTEEGREGAPLPHQLSSLQGKGRAGLRAYHTAVLQATVGERGGHERTRKREGGREGGRERGREKELWVTMESRNGRAWMTKKMNRSDASRGKGREGGREGGRNQKLTHIPAPSRAVDSAILVGREEEG